MSTAAARPVRSILLVGDNRTANNWGGRGASIALIDLLSRKFEIVGTLPGANYFLHAGGGYINVRAPLLFEAARSRRERWPPFDWYVRFEECLGATSFVAEDPSETADNIVRYRGRYAPLEEVHALISKADALVINGEGDCVLTSPPRRIMLYMLGLAELATRMGKPVAFVNMILAEDPGSDLQALARLRESTQAVFRKCRGVLLRDPGSLDYVGRHMPDVRAELIPDSLFEFLRTYERWGYNLPANGNFILPHPEERECWGALDFSRDYICIGGGATAGAQPADAEDAYVDLVRTIQDLGVSVYLTENDGTDGFLRRVATRTSTGLVPVGTPVLVAGSVLANARVFISGRYHPIIMATLGGTPCIFLESMGRKTASLQRLLEYDITEPVFSALPSKEDCARIATLARDYLKAGQECRLRLSAVAQRRCAETERLPIRVSELLA